MSEMKLSEKINDYANEFAQENRMDVYGKLCGFVSDAHILEEMNERLLDIIQALGGK